MEITDATSKFFPSVFMPDAYERCLLLYETDLESPISSSKGCSNPDWNTQGYPLESTAGQLWLSPALYRALCGSEGSTLAFGLSTSGWENKNSTHQASIPCLALLESRRGSGQMVWHIVRFPWRSYWGHSEWEAFIWAKERRGPFLTRRLAYKKAADWGEQDMGGTFILILSRFVCFSP